MYSLFSDPALSLHQNRINCAIFSAMPEELLALEKGFSSYPSSVHIHKSFVFRIYDLDGFKILLTPTGIGTTFAASMITLINTIFKLDCMLFIGTAGSINDNVNIRDVILVDSAFEAEVQTLFSSLAGTPFESCLIHPVKKEKIQPCYLADPQLVALVESLTDISIVKGCVVSSNSFPAPQELFAALKKTNALAIDMETSAFYQVSWLLGIPSLAVRGISNKLDLNGRDEDIESSDIAGSIQAASDCVLRLVETLVAKFLKTSMYSKNLIC